MQKCSLIYKRKRRSTGGHEWKKKKRPKGVEFSEKQYSWMPCLELFQKNGAKVEAANRKDKRRKIQ